MYIIKQKKHISTFDFIFICFEPNDITFSSFVLHYAISGISMFLLHNCFKSDFVFLVNVSMNILMNKKTLKLN